MQNTAVTKIAKVQAVAPGPVWCKGFANKLHLLVISTILTMDISQMALQIFRLKIRRFLLVGLVSQALFGPLPPHIHAVGTWASTRGVSSLLDVVRWKYMK